jgi:hypothetical protein
VAVVSAAEALYIATPVLLLIQVFQPHIQVVEEVQVLELTDQHKLELQDLADLLQLDGDFNNGTLC